MGKKAKQKNANGQVDVPGLGSLTDFEVVEHDKTGHVQRRWLHTAENRVTAILKQEDSNSLLSRSLREWRKVLSDSFLPVGFPHSVSGDYLAYQTYDSLQAFFSTITSLLASRALLEGLGVGDANSSATFAMLLTILKDAMSRVATIVFAHRFGLRIEPDAKRYRFLADLFNDSAFFLELWSPFLGSWGKVVALSTGEALRALCGVAAGASKAALSVHFAKHDNLAELNAKEASQETAVGLIGLLVGTLVVKYVEDHAQVVYLTVALVFAHLIMNYAGVRSVVMENFNRQRANIFFSEYLDSGKLLTPVEVAERERVLLADLPIRDSHGRAIANIEFAQSYGHAMSDFSTARGIGVVHGKMETTIFSTNFHESKFLVKILLKKDSHPAHALTAWFEAISLVRALHEKAAKRGIRLGSDELKQALIELTSEPAATQNANKHVSDAAFWDRVAEKGWDIETQLLETSAPIRVSFLARDRKDN